MGSRGRHVRKKRLRALDGQAPEADKDAPTTLTDALFRLDPDEIFFHLSTGVHSGCPDPWEYSIHDYYVLSEGWNRHPPPHLVAGAFVKSNTDGAPSRSSSAPPTPRNMGKEDAYKATLAQINQDGNLGIGLMRTKPDAPQRKRLDFMKDVVKQMNNGVSLKDIEI